MKRASDDVPDDWSPLLGSVNHVDRILDERPLRANIGRSTNCHALVAVSTQVADRTMSIWPRSRTPNNLRPQPRQPPPVREVC
jgi:hypothetical protein